MLWYLRGESAILAQIPNEQSHPSVSQSYFDFLLKGTVPFSSSDLVSKLISHRFHATMYGGEPVAYPPVLPVPGHTDTKSSNQSNRSWPDHPLPPYMGYTFTAMCDLWSIVQEVLAFYNSPTDRALSERVSLSFAEQKYQKLLAWADTIASKLSYGSHRPLHAYIFQ